MEILATEMQCKIKVVVKKKKKNIWTNLKLNTFAKTLKEATFNTNSESVILGTAEKIISVVCILFLNLDYNIKIPFRPRSCLFDMVLRSTERQRTLLSVSSIRAECPIFNGYSVSLSCVTAACSACSQGLHDSSLLLPCAALVGLDTGNHKEPATNQGAMQLAWRDVRVAPGTIIDHSVPNICVCWPNTLFINTKKYF